MTLARHARRRFCSWACAGIAARRHPVCPACGRRIRQVPGRASPHRCGATGPGPRERRAPGFPGAIPFAALPARCDRCGGPWRGIPGGVGCVLCGRARYVVEALGPTITRAAGPSADASP